ncbi:MAG: hypothetical protein V4683_03310 [Bacteroidota bacterium]
MKQQTIYEVAVIPIGTLNSIRPKETVFTYFSNLKKCIESVASSLAVNNWENNINYTAVYRSIKEKGKYHTEFTLAGNKIFKLSILSRTINPSLSMLGIEESPFKFEK